MHSSPSEGHAPPAQHCCQNTKRLRSTCEGCSAQKLSRLVVPQLMPARCEGDKRLIRAVIQVPRGTSTAASSDHSRPPVCADTTRECVGCMRGIMARLREAARRAHLGHHNINLVIVLLHAEGVRRLVSLDAPACSKSNTVLAARDLKAAEDVQLVQ